MNQFLLRNFLYFSMFLWRMFYIGPSSLLNSSRPMDSRTHLVTVLILACRTVFFMRAISPKYYFSLYLKTISFLFDLGLFFSAIKLPSITKYSLFPSYPSFTIYSLGSNFYSLKVSQSCCFSDSFTSDKI